ncbi:hypothetical protein [Luteimonas changyuni]|uniref:hypothetical protein n=1 Tax=Luteimonas sp. MJ145 TaxID=3129234 RepID=UPI0031B9AE07
MTGSVVKFPADGRAAPDKPEEMHATREEIGQAVVEGVLDPILSILYGYKGRGGPTPLPPAFYDWLREYRARQAAEPESSPSIHAPRIRATPERLEDLGPNWCGGRDTRLVSLHSDIGLLRGELADLDWILEAAERVPSAESTEALLNALECVGLFRRAAMRVLHGELIADDDTTRTLQ